MPLEPDQLDTALAIQAEMTAGLYRRMIASGQMTKDEYRDLLRKAQGDREMNASVFGGPLRALYQVAPLR